MEEKDMKYLRVCLVANSSCLFPSSGPSQHLNDDKNQECWFNKFREALNHWQDR